jgi:lysophospholipase L1-like esterase
MRGLRATIRRAVATAVLLAGRAGGDDLYLDFESAGQYAANVRVLMATGTAAQTDPEAGEPDNDFVSVSGGALVVALDPTPGDGTATRRVVAPPCRVAADVAFGGANNSFGVHFINPANPAQAHLALFNVDASGGTDLIRFSADANPQTGAAGTLVAAASAESGLAAGGGFRRIQVGYATNAMGEPVLSLWAGTIRGTLTLTGVTALASAEISLRFSAGAGTGVAFDNLLAGPVPAVWTPSPEASGSRLVRRLGAGEPQKLVVYGTSLTAGGAWVGQLHNWLTNAWGGALTLVNSGMSGKNSRDGVENLDAKVLAHRPDTVLIEFGMNDAFTQYADPAYNLTLAQARSNLVEMIDRIRSSRPDTEIILQTTNPAWDSAGGSGTSSTARPGLTECYRMVREVAAEHGLLLVDHEPAWTSLQLADPARFEGFVADGTHPSAAGYDAFAMPLLKRRLIGDLRRHDTNRPGPALIEADLCVYGGTSAGVAAALEASRLGRRCVLVTPTPRLGGLSSGGLGWTDLGDASTIGGIAREFYRRIYLHYLDTNAWTHETRAAYIARSSIDPNDARKLMYTFEPRVAAGIFEDFAAEAATTLVPGRLDRGPDGVTKTGATIREIRTDDGLTIVRAAQFIDATYEGDLLAAAGVAYTVGREANAQYGETINGIQTARSTANQLPAGIDPYVTAGSPASGLLPGVETDAGGADGTADDRLQAYCYRLCLTDVASNRAAIAQPAGYREADFELLFRAIEAGQGGNFFKLSPMPNRKTDSNNSGGISMDFIGGNHSLAGGWNYAGADFATREAIDAAHLYWQEGFIWTLQNHARIPVAIRNAWTAWGYPLDEYADSDLRSPQLYIREARRMLNDHVIAQATVNQDLGFVAPDPIGMGGYTMDSHNVQRHAGTGVVRNEGDVQVSPARGAYGIGFRSIAPRQAEADNLLVPVCLAATHIAFGSIRMEPVFMILGQSAAAAASQAIADGLPVQQVDYARLRARLLAAGQVLSKTAPTGSDLVVDNADAAGVETTGVWTASGATSGYWGPNYLHDGNSNKGACAVSYTPVLPADDTYDVYLRWTAHSNRATNAPVDIVHAAGTNTVQVNQTVNGGTWVLLMRTNFNAGSAGRVIVRNGGTTGYVIADAVRFSTGAAPVSLVADDPVAGEDGPDIGRFLAVRDGDTNTAMVVRFAVGGSASAGTDYEALPDSVTIPAGAFAAPIVVIPRPDAEAEGEETVALELAPDAGYMAGPSTSAVVTIRDRPMDGWRHGHFAAGELADPGISGAGADPDGDGRSNALEFALGLNPRADDGPGADPAGHLDRAAAMPSIYLEYDKGATGLRYDVEWSDDLGAAAWSTSGVTAEVYRPGTGRHARGVSLPPGDRGRFLRLSVRQVPP